MRIDTKTTNVVSASGNVFSDLGFEPLSTSEIQITI